MNQEIKFRAWIPSRNEMLAGRNVRDIGMQWCWNSVDIAEAKLMQFTGLKDKNGNEIYEGDILDWFGREKYEVIWENYGFQTKWYIGNGLFDIEPLGSVEDMSVIGNVYENPFLIG